MPGFWVEPGDVQEDRLVLRGEEAHHLVRARRHRVGDCIEAIDGLGNFFETNIVAIDKKEVVCRILSRRDGQGESPIELCLAPALVKGQRFDFVVEKGVEVGVDGIVPLITSRGVVRPGSENKGERWKRLARAAVKQCGRSRLPKIHPAAELGAVIDGWRGEERLALMAVPGDRGEGLRSLLTGGDTGRFGLLIGPEGGFTDAEEELAREKGVRFFSWGERILRADTASIVLAALVLYEAEQALAHRGAV
jgi:16S rRNA (uracil1498-N3)-methyltransferase